MNDLIVLALGIIAAFIAGAAGSAVMILVNDKRMAAVEKVKRRILHGPEKPDEFFTAFVHPSNAVQLRTELAKLMEEINKPGRLIKLKESAAEEIRMKQMTVSPPMVKAVKHIDDLFDMTSEEMEKWLRERK